MGINKVFVEFIRWACVPALLFAFSLCSHNVYEVIKYCLRKHQTPLIFWRNWIKWYIALLCIVVWIVLWVC